MKQRSLLFATVLVLAGCSTSKPPEPIWLGHLTALSGPKSERGHEAVRTAKLALEQAKEEGITMNGREIGIRHVDAAGKDRARAEATRLLTVNQVAALLVGPGIDEIDEVLALARGHDAPVVILDELADDAVAGTALLMAASPGERGRALAAYALETVRSKRAAIVLDRGNRIASAVASAFSSQWRKGGGMIEEIEATGSSSDPPRKLDSPVVLLAVSPGDGWAMRNADNTIGEGALVLSSWEQPPGFDSREGRSLVSATMYTSQASLGESGQPWRTAYEKRFQQAPGRDALVTWDALQFVLAGFQEVKGAYRVRLKPELAGRTSFESITGTMRWREGRPVRTLYLVRQEKGKTTLLRTIPLPET